MPDQQILSKDSQENQDEVSFQKRQKDLEKKLSDIHQSAEDDKYKTRAQNLKIPYSDLKSVPIDVDALSILGEEESRSAGMAVIFKNNSKIVIALTDPDNTLAKQTLGRLGQSYSVDLIMTNPKSLNNVLNRFKTIKKMDIVEIGAIEPQEETLIKLEKEINNVSDIKNLLINMSTTNLLELLLAGAFKLSASDIHFEPEAKQIRLRYRLDGVLNDVASIDDRSYRKIVNRIKVLSKMKLNVHNLPQDGRLTIRRPAADIEPAFGKQWPVPSSQHESQSRHGDVEIRISVLPSEFGETIVMRLLDPRTIGMELGDLGMRDDLLAKVKETLKKPTGAILTTGPTGSGKTTMLYAFVNYLNSPEIKIITIEDPIEYHVRGISQTQVDTRKGYTFANGLRAIVRQDPDIILVGEIRDSETADIALQAALTGHLVLSTIHTNDAAGTIPRLIDFDIRPQIIAPAINMAMAQRLVRKLCSNCKTTRKITGEESRKIKNTLEPIMKKFPETKIAELIELPAPGKCPECNQSGYKGRVGVFEAIEMSREMEKLILKSPAISEVRDLAVSEGMITMIQDAYIKLLNGVTSMEEKERVLG